ncbi:transmembrane protein 272-like [Pygocentrus nattereri]|uniref:Uncharacterized protein n=1 Tax=Pygocentrus nattereri TaxID=42514 RepID=A0A3B4CRU7_PYGNA|nr:transmembrane protein 272-like [Pygocentrus nattereri]
MDTADVWHQIGAVQTMNTSCFSFSKMIMMALSIAQIAMGAVYLQECPKQHYIPIYLLVCGVFSTILTLLSCLPCNKYQGMNLCCYVWNGLVSAFMFCWFISGSMWIYSIYPPNYNSTVLGEPYCNKSLYLFAFWTTTLTYIFLAGLLLAACCVLICTCLYRGATHA